MRNSLMSPKIFNVSQNLKKTDLDRDIFKPMIAEGELVVYDSPEYVKDMGHRIDITLLRLTLGLER